MFKLMGKEKITIFAIKISLFGSLLKQEKNFVLTYLVFMRSLNFMLNSVQHEKKCYNLGARSNFFHRLEM